ncbi:hypothetical protein CDL12_07077 [Handroanthus impetiginosus]|uniref:CCHC-type domain-containing protein n=1 Tax=Handroanthus impetiginosus TaxID=429701 RepID=A0A2G9HRT1_9LAMI|nr:hypothetical protein CDL12_07077 [Handroanthus impetiginosus]
MSNLIKLEFEAMDITGKNYLSWISSLLKLRGEKITNEDLLEKTFSTFHASNVLLQQQYREKDFKKYAKLILCLLLAEQINELLMNHEAHFTGSTPFPEVNAEDKGGQSNPSKDKENICYRCGMKGHWSRIYRTPKHLVKLYQNSIKGKNAERNFTYHNNNYNYDVEANFAYKDDDFKGHDDRTHLDAADFFESHE